MQSPSAWAQGVKRVFLSTTINGVDAKGRVSVPAGFRAVVKNDPEEKIYVWPSFEGGYLEGGGQALLDRYLNLLEEMDPYDDARAAFEQTIFGDTRGLAFDGTGRVTLPKDLIEHAGLDSKAAFVGLGSRFEIWNPDRLAERKANARDFARENKKSLRLPPRTGGGA